MPSFQNLIIPTICLTAIFYSKAVIAQHSIIDQIQKSQASIVTVQAENVGMYKSPRAAGFDRQSGRVILVRNVKAAAYNRSGAGVIIDPSGIIITNGHIIDKANKIKITFFDNRAWPAEVLLVVHNLDLGFLKVNMDAPLPAVVIADSDKLQLGDEIITVGNSEFLKQTVSGGKIKGLGKRQGQNPNQTDLIQTTINLYKGDSGGPLFDYEGRLIGLMTAAEGAHDHSSFAVPANKISKYLEEIKTKK